MTSVLLDRGIRAGSTEFINLREEDVSPFMAPNLAVTMRLTVGAATRDLTLFSYGKYVFSVAAGNDFLFVDALRPSLVRSAPCELVFKAEDDRARALSRNRRDELPLDNSKVPQPLCNLVHTDLSNLQRIVTPHVRADAPASVPLSPAMDAYCQRATYRIDEVLDVQWSAGQLRMPGDGLFSQWITPYLLNQV